MSVAQRGNFWSRRCAAVREAEARESAEQEIKSEQRKAQALESKTDAEILDELGLPDPDTFTDGTDIRQFMEHAVPERLRRRALRRLWTVNPILANVDGLVDYGEDFTDAATVLEDLQTTYQVGKGMLAHVEYVEEQKRLAEEALAEQATDELAVPSEEEHETADSQASVETSDDIVERHAQKQPVTLEQSESDPLAAVSREESTSVEMVVGTANEPVPVVSPAPRRRMRFS